MAVYSPPTCPVLIGRDAELGALVTLLDQAVTGAGAAVFVTGEAGSGKSRLVRELQRAAAARGVQVIAGSCTERDRDFPFAPFVDALRQWLMQPGVEPVDLLGAHGEWLVELLPELYRAYPRRAADLALTPEQTKRQLFEAIAGVLGQRAAHRPLLVVLDDLHWADPTSLELLELLPRRLGAARLLLVGVARGEEISDRLLATLTALRRARLLVTLELDPLPDAEVRAMLRAMLPADPGPLVEQIIVPRAGGNPFFVEELLVTLARTGEDWLPGEAMVPATVRDTVLRRLADLRPEVQAVARLLAVAGQRVRLDLLRGASGAADADLAAALAALRDHGLLLDISSPGEQSIGFKHALTRDAILAGLPIEERRPLHRRVGETLERLAAERPDLAADGDLGYHYHAAGVWEKALAHAGRAGEAAWAIRATVEALGHFRRSLDAALALNHPDAARLHWRCGQTLDLLGRFDASRDHLDEALRLARRHGDPALEQLALYELAGLFASRDYRRAHALAEQALDLARANADRRGQGLALNRLGNILTNLQQFAAGRALHEDALRIFEELGDRWGMADSSDLIGMARYLSGEVPEARAACRQAVEMFAELEATERIASAITTRGLYLAVLDGPCGTDAPVTAFRDDARRGLELCHTIGWRSGEAYALVALACADLGDADFGSAARQLDQALAIAGEIGHEQWEVIARFSSAILHTLVFDDRRALAQLEQALPVAHRIGSVQWETRLRAWIARCTARLGDVPAAEALLAPLLPEGLPASISQRRALFTHAELQLAAGRPDAALDGAERLLTGATGPRDAATMLLRARTLAALERTAEAVATYHDADRLAATYGPRSVRWQAIAGVLHLQPSPDPAALATVRAEIAAVAGSLPEDWRATFLTAPEVQPWLETEPARRHAPAGSPALTRREREVTVLVALGLTNKEIAARLSLAEKTVEMHVSNALGKLGFTHRAQLAAWAVAEGLARPATPG